MFKIKAALVALALLFASLAHAAIGTPTSAGTNGATTSVSSLTVTTTAAIVSGNLVVVAIAMKSSAGTSVSSVSDGTNTYTQGAFKVSTNGTVDRVELWYKENAAAVSSGATLTITLAAALGATNPGINAGIAQVSGIVTSSSLDSSAIGNAFSNSGTTLTATTGTMATNNEIIFGALTQALGSAYTESAGFSNIFSNVGGANRGAVSLGYDIVAATTAVNYSPSVATTTGLAGIAVPFRGAAAPPKPDTLAMMGVGAGSTGGGPPCVTTPISFTLSGAFTWTNTTNCINFTVHAVGGGGSGASGATGAGHATGGGGAESCTATFNLSAGATVGYTVGAGGAGVTNNFGNAGGNSFFCNATSNCAGIGGSAVQVGAHGGGAGNRGAGSQTGGIGGTGGIGTCLAGGRGGNLTGASGIAASGGGGAAGAAVGLSGVDSASTSTVATNGGAGDNGTGGGGGTGNTSTTAGTNGGTGTEDPVCGVLGSGGGGGGQANASTNTPGAGSGGFYGGGGGGASNSTAGGTNPSGGTRSDGYICIKPNF